jgi:SAM-dependent methyltransferase
MDQSYANSYRDLYQNHWWWRSRKHEILRQLETHFRDGSDDRSILDVGCGDGLFFDELQSFGKVTGVESDPETQSESGKWKHQIHLQPFDVGFQPVEKYDAILMLDILEHMPDPLAALKHAKTLLKDDGVLLATVPAFMSLWTSHDDLNHHVIRYRTDSFCPLVSDGGFKVQQSRYLFHWTCPVKLAIRLKEQIFGSTPKTPTVPSPIVNRICELLSRFEQATLSRIPMPFGSSLMVVARQ